MRDARSSPGLHSARTLRALAAVGAGALACALGALVGRAQLTLEPHQRPVSVWAADRDANRVLGLDTSLIVVRSLDVAWPLDVEVRADGGLWVLRSGGPTAGFGRRLDSFAADGQLINESYLESADALALHAGRDALVIERDAVAHGLDRLWRIEPDGHATILFEDNGLACVTCDGKQAWLAWSSGTLGRLDPAAGKKLLAVRSHVAEWTALAPGAEPGSLFALDRHAGRRLCYLAPDLTQRWAIDLDIDARALGPVAGEERVWLADSAGVRVRRYGPGGQIELERSLLSFAPDRPLALPAGGVLFATPGAIVRLDALGQILPGQGGFAWLSDLARVP